MYRSIIISFVFLLSGVASSQNLIGYHSDDIKKIIRESQSDLSLNDNTKNEYYNYLKFENSLNTKTLLCFLSETDTCTYTKLMCDYSELNETRKMLNEKYNAIDENKWIEEKNGDKFNITIKKEEWYFTIITRKKM